MMENPKCEEARLGKSGIAEVIGAALLWSGVAHGFFRPTAQAMTLAPYIGSASSMLLSAAGIALVLVVVGFLGEKKRANAFFVVYVILSWSRRLCLFAAAGTDYMVLVTCAYYAFSGASFALFVVAWFQYYSEKPASTKPAFIASYTFYAIFITIVIMQLPHETANLVSGVLQTIGALLMLVRPKYDKPMFLDVKLTKQRKTVFFIFGIMIGALVVICPQLITTSITMQANSAWFEVLWAVLALVVGTLCFRFRSAGGDRVSISRLLFPLLTLGALALPFLLHGLDGLFPVAIIFTVLCESIIYASGDSGAYRTVTIAGRKFVFWERSWVLIGYAIGTVAAALVVIPRDADLLYRALFALAVIYVVLCLVTVAIHGRVFEKKTDSQTYHEVIKGVSSRIAADYALTPRENDVLEELVQGRSIPYIQEALSISKGTAVSHINHIYQKLGVHRRQELLDIAQAYLDASR